MKHRRFDIRGLLVGLLICASMAQPTLLHASDEVSPQAGLKVAVDGITVSVASAAIVARPEAPLPIDLTVMGDGPRPRTGRLVMGVQENDRCLFIWTSAELSLNQQPRTITVLLPPLPISEGHDELTGALVWEEEGHRTTFPAPLQLVTKSGIDRSLILGLCAGVEMKRKAVLATTSLAGVLADAAKSGWLPDAHVAIVPLTSDRMPLEPLALCAYQVVVVAGNALNQLSDHQVSALEHWLCGGGSLALIPTTNPSDAVLDLLHRIALAQGLTLDDGHGHLTNDEGPRLLRVGVGHLAIIPLGMLQASDHPIAGVAPFLWKIRADIQSDINAGKILDGQALATAQEVNPYRPYRRTFPQKPQVRPAGPVTKAADGNAAGATKPEEIEPPSFLRQSNDTLVMSIHHLLTTSAMTPVPFSLAVIVMVIFALLIGPGDWLLLGRLKARRFTWILFPALSVAATLVLVALFNGYLGRSEHHSRLTIVDCGAGGAVLRTNCLEQVFSGRASRITSDVHDALSAPWINESIFTRGRARNMVQPALYEGRLPGNYRLGIDVEQWAPSSRRFLSFEAPAQLPLRLDQDLSLGELTAFAQGFSKRFFPAYLGYWHGTTHKDLLNSPAVLITQPGVMTYYDNNRNWMHDLNVAPRWGWFTLASQLSPTGGADAEDLPIYDPDDRSHWLLVAAIRDGDNVWITRRLFPYDGKQEDP